MLRNIISRSQCLEKFAEAGIEIRNHLIGNLIESGLPQKDLEVCLSFARTIGSNNFRNFLYNSQDADVSSNKALSYGQKTIMLIKVFAPAFKKLFSDSSLKRAGQLRIVDGAKPFRFAIEILTETNKPYFVINFDLKISPTSRATLILGNFHVLIPAISIEKQRKEHAERIADLALKAFINCFESKNISIVAANTKLHHSYHYPSIDALVAKLNKKGVISTEEMLDFFKSKEYVDLKFEGAGLSKISYLRSLRGKSSGSFSARKVESLLRREIDKIKRAGTASHKIAFKKAGFKIEERLKKITGVNPTEKGKPPKRITLSNIVASPTGTPQPYWRLASAIRRPTPSTKYKSLKHKQL